jgi:hypothetical protein
MSAIITDKEIAYYKALWDLDTQLVFFEYLVNLRDQGITNMMGAAEFLEVRFGVTTDGFITGTILTSKDILLTWINTFDLPVEQQPSDGRTLRDTAS